MFAAWQESRCARAQNAHQPTSDESESESEAPIKPVHPTMRRASDRPSFSFRMVLEELADQAEPVYQWRSLSADFRGGAMEFAAGASGNKRMVCH